MQYQFTTDYRVEDFVINTTWDTLPKAVQERAVVCGIDLMLALLLGSNGEQFKVGLSMASQHYKEGTVPVVGSEKTFGVLGATVAMSHASNSFDIDDGHNMIKGHPGTSFVAGILAAGLEKNVTYAEFLTALIVAYEVSIRCGMAVQEHYGYLHSTGTYGAFGTAAGMAKLYGVSREQLNTALSIAEFHAPLTPVMRSVQYPSMNKDGVPFGALVGAAALFETLAGSTGYGNLLETPEFSHLVESLGHEFEVMRLYFKPYTCCRWAHQPIKACIDLMQEHAFGAEDVVNVDVKTFDSAAQLSKKVPTTADEAQYNIAWPVASALVHGDVGFKQVHESGLQDARVFAMMDKLHFSVDPELDAQFPQKRLARVEITLKDGRVLTSPVYSAPGEHTDNVDLAWMQEKFLRISKPILSEEKQSRILEMLQKDLNTPLTHIVTQINK